jgi:anhydro-N-acetylmuramic acid kinase
MKLARLQTGRRLTVLGINSGTSGDNIDLAVLRLERQQGKFSWHWVDGATRRYRPKLQELIWRVADAPSVSLDEVIHLDSALGQAFAEAAAGMVRKLERGRVRVDAIASHGQTVRHAPQRVKRDKYTVSGTLQLGSPEVIAARTGLPVVADFRQAAVARGLEGAPITTSAMRRLFAEKTKSRLLVNIGGMANYFYFPAAHSRGKESAADCGPGNCLSDLLARRLLGQPYDRGGRRAAAGAVSQRLLSLMLAHPFFRGKLRSTGREVFGPAMEQLMLDFRKHHRLRIEDLLATAAELTVNAIVGRIWPIVSRDDSLTEVLVFGGGRRNRHFMKRLRHQLPDIPIRSVDETGVDGDLVEAAAYAVMGEAAIRGEALDLGVYRGKAHCAVCGRIVQ